MVQKILDVVLENSNPVGGEISSCGLASSSIFGAVCVCRGVRSMGTMGAWAPINISSGVTNGCQHTVLNITENIEIP